MKPIELYKKIESTVGGLKFGISTILIFAAFLVWGTFAESYHGTEYANRLVYKSIPFFMVQISMFFSILFATLIRLPFKKRLSGFYVLHLGLLTIFIGSFITFKSGVDGTISLDPKTPVKDVTINEDQFVIEDVAEQKEITFDLPFRSGEIPLNLKYQNFELLKFLPFSEPKTIFKKSPHQLLGQDQSSEYEIHNPNVSQKFILSLNPDGDYESTLSLGPLSVHYLPFGLLKCFATDAAYVIWNAENNLCDLPSKISKGKVVEVLYTTMSGPLRFLPDSSPLPLNEKKEFDDQSYWRVFSRGLFEKAPHLFLFGKGVAYYNKETKNWESFDLAEGKTVQLPWMGFELKLLNHYPDQYPVKVPENVPPIQDNGQTIVGGSKAIELKAYNKTFWITSETPSSLSFEGKKYNLYLSKKKITLPFEMVLDQFKMDFDPGTQNPASYESFVNVFDGKSTEKTHIFMNHPLKKIGFTFYQASYFQLNENTYGSVLSVNYDPGRPIKYGGSILLVLGSIAHYFLNRKKRPAHA